MGTDFVPLQVTVPIVAAGLNCWQIRNFYVTAYLAVFLPYVQNFGP
jgi:hypothetical protein